MAGFVELDALRLKMLAKGKKRAAGKAGPSASRGAAPCHMTQMRRELLHRRHIGASKTGQA